MSPKHWKVTAHSLTHSLNTLTHATYQRLWYVATKLTDVSWTVDSARNCHTRRLERLTATMTAAFLLSPLPTILRSLLTFSPPLCGFAMIERYKQLIMITMILMLPSHLIVECDEWIIHSIVTVYRKSYRISRLSFSWLISFNKQLCTDINLFVSRFRCFSEQATHTDFKTK